MTIKISRKPKTELMSDQPTEMITARIPPNEKYPKEAAFPKIEASAVSTPSARMGVKSIFAMWSQRIPENIRKNGSQRDDKKRAKGL